MNHDSTEEAIQAAIRLLTEAGYRVIPPPKPREELPGQIELTDYDSVTGELLSADIDS